METNNLYIIYRSESGQMLVRAKKEFIPVSAGDSVNIPNVLMEAMRNGRVAAIIDTATDRRDIAPGLLIVIDCADLPQSR